MQCYQCGEHVLAEAIFCHRCGARLDTEGGATVGSAPAEPEQPHPAVPASDSERPAAGGRDDQETEQTLWEGGYSSKAMFGRWFVTLVATFGLIVGGVFIWRGDVWLAIAAAIVLLWAYQSLVLIARRSGVHYRLTNQRFIHELGVLRRVTDRIDLIDVSDITFEQGVIDRLMGVGIIHIVSKDPSHPELTLKGIEGVGYVAGLIDKTFRAERRRRGLVLENLRRAPQ